MDTKRQQTEGLVASRSNPSLRHGSSDFRQWSSDTPNAAKKGVRNRHRLTRRWERVVEGIALHNEQEILLIKVNRSRDARSDAVLDQGT
jgi:hypothetical protein